MIRVDIYGLKEIGSGKTVRERRREGGGERRGWMLLCFVYSYFIFAYILPDFSYFLLSLHPSLPPSYLLSLCLSRSLSPSIPPSLPRLSLSPRVFRGSREGHQQQLPLVWILESSYEHGGERTEGKMREGGRVGNRERDREEEGGKVI
jgi:hypothetical protein